MLQLRGDVFEQGHGRDMRHEVSLLIVAALKLTPALPDGAAIADHLLDALRTLEGDGN